MYDREYLENLTYVELLSLAKELSLTKIRVKKDLLIQMILESNPEDIPEGFNRRATFDVPPELPCPTRKKKTNRKTSRKGKKKSGNDKPSFHAEPSTATNTIDENESEEPESFRPAEEITFSTAGGGETVGRRGTFTVEDMLTTSATVETTIEPRKRKGSNKRSKRSTREETIIEEEPTTTTDAEAEPVPMETFHSAEDVVEETTEGMCYGDRRGTFTVQDIRPSSVWATPSSATLKHKLLSLSEPRTSLRRKWSVPQPLVVVNRSGVFSLIEDEKENRTNSLRETSHEGEETRRHEPTVVRKSNRASTKFDVKNAVDNLPTLKVTDSPANRSVLATSVFERLTTPMSLKERRSICSATTVKTRISTSPGVVHRVALLSALRSSKASATSAAKPLVKSKGTPRKMPDFAKIHKANFDKMTSLVEFKKRQLERAEHLMSPVRLAKTIDKVERIVATKKRSMLPVFRKTAAEQHPVVSSTSSEKPPPRDRQTRQDQKDAIRKKTIANKSFHALPSMKEVRTNKRFKLLYESSRLKRAI